MRRELLRRSFAESDVADQLDAFRAWTAQLAGDPAAAVEPQVALDFTHPAAGEEDVEATDGSSEEQGSEAVAPEAPPTPPAEPEEGADPAPPLPLEATPAGLPTIGYVVSLPKSDWSQDVPTIHSWAPHIYHIVVAKEWS